MKLFSIFSSPPCPARAANVELNEGVELYVRADAEPAPLSVESFGDAPFNSTLGDSMTLSHISYRAALKSDAREMVDVHFAAVHAIGSDYYSSDVKLAWSPPPDAARQEWLSDLISQDSAICVVAVLDHNTIVGFCVALSSEAQLKALYVHPNHSGSGIGHALLQCVESRCRAIGFEALELKASCNAETFYRHSGYDVIGPTTQPLTDGVSMAATHMVKRFSRVAQPCGQPDLAHTAAQGRLP